AVDSGKISGKTGKDLLPEMFESGKTAGALIEEKGLTQVSDSSAIAGVVTQALEANPKQVGEFKAGNERVLQYLVGQVMKLSKGRANPQLVVTELKKQLQD
ncbi:MAG: Asp-tRNA(Asn)/Glu-tRNA(Gln) amidotransferase GatCAB subunit B, partial [Lentisphaeria bacterium]|nr:Asp-tRNA(Asn)/Glu-tRNA(Gln) amidotransferase GatCAB subunit B [Lentisphaeria bacterium]